MKIVLFSNTGFLINELKKSTIFTNINIVKTIDELYSLDINENIIFLHHLDYDENYQNLFNIISELFDSYKLIVLRNNPNNIEGCSLLKHNVKAYMHAISNIHILEDAINAVINGNVWLYPELMQFLISSIPLQENNKNKLLEKVSVKELEVLELVAQGLNNHDISQTLNLAEVTVKKHVSSLLKKLNQKDRLSLALFFKNQA